MVLVQVGAVVVLTTGHTATTGVLAVLANTTVTGLDMTAAVVVSLCSFGLSVCPVDMLVVVEFASQHPSNVEHRTSTIAEKNHQTDPGRKKNSLLSCLRESSRHLVGGCCKGSTRSGSGWVGDRRVFFQGLNGGGFQRVCAKPASLARLGL